MHTTNCKLNHVLHLLTLTHVRAPALARCCFKRDTCLSTTESKRAQKGLTPWNQLPCSPNTYPIPLDNHIWHYPAVSCLVWCRQLVNQKRAYIHTYRGNCIIKLTNMHLLDITKTLIAAASCGNPEPPSCLCAWAFLPSSWWDLLC